MTEITTLLEVAKEEPSTPPSTPEKAANIKERLNLHVKRRLQQDSLPVHEDLSHNYNNNNTIVNNKNEVDSNTKDKKSEKTKQKTRKPYQKRATKPANDGPVRKYKRTKSKQIGNTTNVNDVVSDSVNAGQLSLTASAGGNGDDDGSHDGGNEVEGKCASTRERDKCPDVLAMVLSAKKRALMQNPEVQDFLSKIMNAIKS